MLRVRASASPSYLQLTASRLTDGKRPRPSRRFASARFGTLFARGLGPRPGSGTAEDDQPQHEADRHHGIRAERPTRDPRAQAGLGEGAVGSVRDRRRAPSRRGRWVAARGAPWLPGAILTATRPSHFLLHAVRRPLCFTYGPLIGGPPGVQSGPVAARSRPRPRVQRSPSSGTAELSGNVLVHDRRAVSLASFARPGGRASPADHWMQSAETEVSKVLLRHTLSSQPAVLSCRSTAFSSARLSSTVLSKVPTKMP
jgi:hypothetical protein